MSNKLTSEMQKRSAMELALTLRRFSFTHEENSELLSLTTPLINYIEAELVSTATVK